MEQQEGVQVNILAQLWLVKILNALKLEKEFLKLEEMPLIQPFQRSFASESLTTFHQESEGK